MPNPPTPSTRSLNPPNRAYQGRTARLDVKKELTPQGEGLGSYCGSPVVACCDRVSVGAPGSRFPVACGNPTARPRRQ